MVVYLIILQFLKVIDLPLEHIFNRSYLSHVIDCCFNPHRLLLDTDLYLVDKYQHFPSILVEGDSKNILFENPFYQCCTKMAEKLITS